MVMNLLVKKILKCHGNVTNFSPKENPEGPRDVSCVRISARGGANRGATRQVLSRALLSVFLSVISIHGRRYGISFLTLDSPAQMHPNALLGLFKCFLYKFIIFLGVSVVFSEPLVECDKWCKRQFQACLNLSFTRPKCQSGWAHLGTFLMILGETQSRPN